MYNNCQSLTYKTCNVNIFQAKLLCLHSLYGSQTRLYKHLCRFNQ